MLGKKKKKRKKAKVGGDGIYRKKRYRKRILRMAKNQYIHFISMEYNAQKEEEKAELL